MLKFLMLPAFNNLRVLVYSLRARGLGPTVTRVRRRFQEWLRTRNLVDCDSISPDLQSRDSSPLIPCAAEPVLSIIIPVYNQWAFTVTCLASLRDACGELPTEVLLADDGSTDETCERSRAIPGLQIVRDGINRGFLRNCNHAATRARGKILLFLNNDTKCAPGSLSRLVATLESDLSIGLVAPLILNSDGTVQDAGGLVWNDGSAGNLGRYDHPGLSAYRFRREADYLTGACIAIPRTLWESLGGFDEHFVPAYCEDTDLAFRVRARGLRTVVDPVSRILHYEGVTHGRSVSSGLKAYQAVNLVKFSQRWRSEIAQLPSPLDTSLRARDRVGNAPIILVVDRQVPTPERDAGSVCTLHYLTSLRELGCRITFIGLEGPRHPSARILEDLGIEVVAGIGLGGDWSSWLRSWASEVDLAILNRPAITEQFLPHLRKAGFRGKWSYLGHDLHFSRFSREAALPGQVRVRQLEQESQRWYAIESRLHREADHILAITHEEAALVEQHFSRKALIFPGFRFGDPRPMPSIGGRSHLLFVGGGSHAPNHDAMEWFLGEVLPELHALGHEPMVDIVGADHPSSWSHFKRVTLHGPVDDVFLAQLMNRARIALLPLRFGAGLKGKLVQALHFGLPVVATSIALEGLSHDARDRLVPVNDKQAMARRIIELLTNDEAWRHAAESSREAAQAFTPLASRRAMHSLLVSMVPMRTWRREPNP